LALGVGETELKLLEMVPRPGPALVVGSRIALLPVDGVPPSIDHVRRRLTHQELTTTARAELTSALDRIVLSDPPRFLRFFNEAPAVSRRFHLLELLPGIGKKTMLAIVEERKRGPFPSFLELEQRTHVKAPEKLIVARIELELSGVEDKYRLFVAP
jgi:putative nucleotide binding protein